MPMDEILLYGKVYHFIVVIYPSYGYFKFCFLFHTTNIIYNLILEKSYYYLLFKKFKYLLKEFYFYGFKLRGRYPRDASIMKKKKKKKKNLIIFFLGNFGK